MCSKIQFRSLDFSLSELIFNNDLCLGLSENTCFSKILKQCLRSYLKTVVCVCNKYCASVATGKFGRLISRKSDLNIVIEA